MVEERLNAKKTKDFKRADDLRNQILSAGYLIEDTTGGARVRKK